MVSAHSPSDASASSVPCDASATCDPSAASLPSTPSVSSGPPARPAQQSTRTQAEKLHETLLLSQATSNLARRKFISALLALSESKLFLQLGSPSIEHYARTHFGIERAVTYEYLRVAKALRDLPRCDEDFRAGKLTWSALREITKVATAESEEEWIEFARRYPGARLRGEVKEALLKNRKKPRKGGYSLPGLRTRLVFELEPEEQDLASRALEEVAREMSERLEGAEVEPKNAFLFMARRFLEDRAREDAGAGDPVDPEKSPYTILYHRCPDCRRAGLPTAEGVVEIDSEVVDHVEGDARKVVIEDSEEEAARGDGGPEGSGSEDRPPAEIDRPNPPSLVRKIRLRDGRACANPGCDRTRGLHAHHIIGRARGGPTAVHNEVLLCSSCHALAHAGYLTVEGNSVDGLTWTVSAMEKSTDFWTRIRELSAVPEVQVIEARSSESTAVDSEGTADPESTAAAVDPEADVESTAVDSDATADPQSTAVDSEDGSSERLRDLEQALRTLGFSAPEAKRRLERAWESFGARASGTSDEEIVKVALRLRAA